MPDWPVRFAIVTACNPDGRIVANAVNTEADRKLAAELERRELVHFRITGGSLDGRHQEPGWGIATHDLAVARDLSKRYQQLAFFWIERGQLKLVDTETGEIRDLALWSERWRRS